MKRFVSSSSSALPDLSTAPRWARQSLGWPPLTQGRTAHEMDQSPATRVSWSPRLDPAAASARAPQLVPPRARNAAIVPAIQPSWRAARNTDFRTPSRSLFLTRLTCMYLYSDMRRP